MPINRGDKKISSEEETKIDSEASDSCPNSSDAPNATTHSENAAEQGDLKIFLPSRIVA